MKEDVIFGIVIVALWVAASALTAKDRQPKPVVVNHLKPSCAQELELVRNAVDQVERSFQSYDRCSEIILRKMK